MTAQILLATLQERGVELWMDAGRLRYRAPTGVLTAEDKAVLAAMQESILRLLSQAASANDHSQSTAGGNIIGAAPFVTYPYSVAVLSKSSEYHPHQLVTQITPVWVHTPSACYACGTTLRWQSIYGALICVRCHPPASSELVAAWEDDEP